MLTSYLTRSSSTRLSELRRQLQCQRRSSRVQRKLTLRSTTIPVEQYATVRNFFERIRAVEQSPVVLARNSVDHRLKKARRLFF